jgi:hypothetical protein
MFFQTATSVPGVADALARTPDDAWAMRTPGSTETRLGRAAAHGKEEGGAGLTRAGLGLTSQTSSRPSTQTMMCLAPAEDELRRRRSPPVLL